MVESIARHERSSVDIAYDRTMRESKHRCAEIARQQMRIERESYGTQDFIYGAYLGGVHSYFSDMPSRHDQSFHTLADPKLIAADRAEREASGQQPALSDWFGPGFVGFDLGFHRIFSADLIDHTGVPVRHAEYRADDTTPPSPLPVHTHFSAHSLMDIDFQKKVFAQVRLAKQSEGLMLHTTLLRPFGGLRPYEHEPYLYRSMVHLISEAYGLTDPGGTLLVELSHLDTVFVNEWVMRLQKLGIHLERKNGTNVIRIDKTKESPTHLPDFEAMRAADPSFSNVVTELIKRLSESREKQNA